MKYLLLLLPLLSPLTLSAQGSVSEGLPDSVAILQTLENYRKATLAFEGETAAGLVNQHTFEYFDELRRLAIHADSASVADLPIGERYVVLQLRQAVALTKLRTTSPKEFFVLLVNAGWVEGTLKTISIGNIHTFEDWGMASPIVDGKPVTQVTVRFEREEGVWKVDIASVMRYVNVVLRLALEESDVSDHEFLAIALTAWTGIEFSDDLWHPLVSDGSP